MNFLKDFKEWWIENRVFLGYFYWLTPGLLYMVWGFSSVLVTVHLFGLYLVVRYSWWNDEDTHKDNKARKKQ